MKKAKARPGLSKGQQAMLEDGCPAALLLPQQTRAAEWVGRSPRPASRVSIDAIRPRAATTMPLLTGLAPDAGTRSVLDDVATRSRTKSLTKIALMKDRIAVREGQRWDAGKARWVVDNTAPPASKPRSSALVSSPRPPPKPRNKTDDVALKLLGLTLPGIKKLAVANKMWKPEYDKLALGLCRMTIGNRLRGMIKRQEKIKW